MITDSELKVSDKKYKIQFDQFDNSNEEYPIGYEAEVNFMKS